MEVAFVNWSTPPTWCVVCPRLSIYEQNERSKWCENSGIEFTNIGVRFWFQQKKDAEWFVLRWS